MIFRSNLVRAIAHDGDSSHSGSHAVAPNLIRQETTWLGSPPWLPPCGRMADGWTCDHLCVVDCSDACPVPMAYPSCTPEVRSRFQGDGNHYTSPNASTADDQRTGFREDENAVRHTRRERNMSGNRSDSAKLNQQTNSSADVN